GRFGTATVETPEGERIDVAATRRETYARPGALPRVSPAPIEEDLLRRDFTVHAMAIPITTAHAEGRLDPLGGKATRVGRRLRILHERSFDDDPTRAYRAARYANRLGFTVERATRRALQESLGRGAFESISGDRRRRELQNLFSEPNRADAVAQLARLGLV